MSANENSLFSVVCYQSFHLAFICFIFLFIFQGLQRFCTEHKIKLSKVEISISNL